MTPRGRLLTADAIRWGNTDPAGLPQDRHTLTDAAHAERFARAFAGEFRFDHTRNLWLAWSHTRWAVDLTGRRYARAIELARELYESATREADLDARRRLATFAIGCENRARLENVLHLAKFHPLLADAGDLWDADPWALNTPGGLVDLRSGQVRPSTPADRVTFQTAVALADTADCERWRRFLREVFRGDDEIVRWLQKVMGYALTGITSEQFLVIAFGGGANGKSTLFATVAWLLADYGMNLPFSSFEFFDRSAIPNDLAALRGRRFVTASETQDGTRLNEARVKALTGEDTLTARFLHGEFFSFRPVAKLFLFVNHRPVVRDDSHGFWRRVRLLPFLETFAVNGALAGELRAEGPGILRWALDGCLAWQRDGLTVPAAVAGATKDYETDSDALAPFLEACCVLGGDRSVRASQVYGRYRQWCDEANLGPRERLSQTAFGRKLKTRFDGFKDRAGYAYLGVGLREA